MRSKLAFLCLLVPLLAAAATAADLTPVHDGDRVTGILPAEEAEAGLLLDALEGTLLHLKVKATGERTLRPEVRIYDPDDVRVEPGSLLRTSGDGRKARIRRLELTATGRYTIVVRATGSSTGEYRLKVRAEHPRKVKAIGSLAVAEATSLFRFPAFAGTVARWKVSGRDGLLPSVDSLIEPGVVLRSLAGGEATGAVVRHDAVECAEHGDYRIVVESREGTTGRYRGKVRLDHPVEEPRAPVVDGQPAGTFTDGKSEPPPVPGPGPGPIPGPLSWRVLESGSYSNVKTAKTVVARDHIDYYAMWAEHHPPMPPGIGAPDVAPPAVDFSREMVVAIFLGPRSWLTRVQVIAVTSVGGGIQVTTLESAQPSAVLCHPYEIIAVTRTDGPVTFAWSIE